MNPYKIHVKTIVRYGYKNKQKVEMEAIKNLTTGVFRKIINKGNYRCRSSQ